MKAICEPTPFSCNFANAASVLVGKMVSCQPIVHSRLRNTTDVQNLPALIVYICHFDLPFDPHYPNLKPQYSATCGLVRHSITALLRNSRHEPVIATEAGKALHTSSVNVLATAARDDSTQLR